MANIYDEIRRNRHNTWVIVTIVILFFLFIGFGFDYYYGLRGRTLVMPVFTIFAVIAGSIASYSSYMYGDRLILSSTHARELDLNDPKQMAWHNVVSEMSIAAGLPMPKTFIIDDPDPNAFATGRDPNHASIAVTRGLLDMLNRDELQGVCAHEMSHIRNFDIRLMLMIAVLVGSIALISDWASRGLFYGRRREGSSSSGKAEGGIALIILVIWLISVILAPILSQIMAMFVSRRREYLADASGAELTRNPIALASALEKIESRIAPTKSISRGSAHLCIADPKGSSMNLKEGWFADIFATHPPMPRRIATLKEMAYVA
jgi:heat shock protein HtpX